MDEDCPVNFANFREWIKINFPEINEETWEQLLAEDEQYCYHQAEVPINNSDEYPFVDNSIEISSGQERD